MNIIHYPYPSLKIEWAADKNSFRLMLPWIQLDIDIDSGERDWIKLATLYLHHSPNHPLVQKFLENFSALPIAFQKKITWPSDNLIPMDAPASSIEFLSPKDFLSFVNIDASQDAYLFENWNWDLNSFLNHTYLAAFNAYDPISALTLGLSFSWNHEAKMHHTIWGLPQVLDLMRIQNESLFFDHMAQLLESTLFVTHQVPPLLLKAKETFPEAKEILQHFYIEELGHDRLMEKALNVLGESRPRFFNPSSPLILLMQLFDYATYHSPIAITAFISLFEGRLYPELDPLARILEKSSKPKAAKGYAQHFHINKSHNHNDEAWELMQSLPLQPKENIILIFRILELASHLISELDDQFFEQALNSLDPLEILEVS